MKVICNYNDPFSLPEGIPNSFDFGLELNKEYLVMGIVLYKGNSSIYYLIDSKGKPNWFPFQLFNITNNKISSKWFLNTEFKEDSDIEYLFGFKELCFDNHFYDQLVDRNKEALSVYFRRKEEEKSSNVIDY